MKHAYDIADGGDPPLRRSTNSPNKVAVKYILTEYIAAGSASSKSFNTASAMKMARVELWMPISKQMAVAIDLSRPVARER